jgi:hypothetical protein
MGNKSLADGYRASVVGRKKKKKKKKGKRV